MKDKSKNGLWKESFGSIGATLKVLEDVGMSSEYFSLIRHEPALAENLVIAVRKYLWTQMDKIEVLVDYHVPLDVLVARFVKDYVLLQVDKSLNEKEFDGAFSASVPGKKKFICALVPCSGWISPSPAYRHADIYEHLNLLKQWYPSRIYNIVSFGSSFGKKYARSSVARNGFNISLEFPRVTPEETYALIILDR